MSFTMTRRAALATLASLVCGWWAAADTFDIVKRTCPVCDTEYETAVTMSGTRFGMRLDLRPVGPTASPPRIGVCPKCGFADFQHGKKYPEEELRAIKAYVRSAEYAKLVKSDKTYYRVAKTYETLGRPPMDAGFAYLYAAWDTEGEKGDDQRSKYLSASRAAFEKALADEGLKGERRRTAQLLRGELLRRLGKFDDAKAHFEAMAKDDSWKAEPFPQLIEQELELIDRKDDQPHRFARKKDQQ